MTDLYTNFNTAFTAFRLANNIRGFVETLCQPNGSSDLFPKMAETLVDVEFLSFWSHRFDEILNIVALDDPPAYMTAAKDGLLAELRKLEGQRVESLLEPMRIIEQQFTYHALRAARSCEPEIQKLSGKTVDEIEMDLRHAACGSSFDYHATINTLINIIRQVGGLPTSDTARVPHDVTKGYYSARDLIEHLGIPMEKLPACQKRLERWRATHPPFSELIVRDNPGRNESTYLYREDALAVVLKDYLEKTDTSNVSPMSAQCQPQKNKLGL